MHTGECTQSNKSNNNPQDILIEVAKKRLILKQKVRRISDCETWVSTTVRLSSRGVSAVNNIKHLHMLIE